MATKMHPDVKKAIDKFRVTEKVNEVLENDSDEEWLEDCQELKRAYELNYLLQHQGF